ncbi:hypothetical protein JW960_03170 [candidate division KSB1 bacterium]|nr:hypothetical protein [candidate division KSB1 bacterium]
MNLEIMGILLSFAFVFLLILCATIVQKMLKLSSEFSRKIIHIAVGNWVLLAYYFFSNWLMASIVPAAFIVINYLSYRYKIFKAMELDDKNPGTVYYSISLTILTVLTFYFSPVLTLPYLGIMAMVWGDGFAAVIGRKYPIKILRGVKSLGGMLAFIIFTFAASVVYLILIRPQDDVGFMLATAGTIATGGSVIELYSMKNIDNLTVPLGIGIVLGFLEIGKVFV